MHLYATFGSNLDQTQMRQRCPSAKLRAVGTLIGQQLTFAGRSTLWGGGVATLRPTRGVWTPCAVYHLNGADLQALDGYEGAPWWYRRRLMSVAVPDGPDQFAWVYTLPDRVPMAAPTAVYIERIAAGYATHGFDRAVLIDAVRRVAAAEWSEVFVYGSLLRGLSNHPLLQRYEAVYVGAAKTAEAGFTMRSLGAFPAVSRGGENEIRGEVYRVNAAGLLALDRLEGHPDFYRRSSVRVAVAGLVRQVWTYLLDPDAGRPVIPSGDWRIYTAGSA